MISTEKLGALKKERELAIVWRNSAKVETYRRQHTLHHAGETPQYVLEEFVDDGLFGHWTQISDLEVVRGGLVA